MPPHAVASPKKKRLKCKASDASKAAASKKPHAVNLTETSSMSLVSLSLTEFDAVGGRNTQLKKIRVVLESQSQNWKPKGTTSLGTLNPVNPQAPEPPRKGRKSYAKVQPPPYSPDPSSLDASTLQSGGRFGFVTSTTTCIIPPGTEPNPQTSNDSYLAMGMKAAEHCNENAPADHTCSCQPSLNATFPEHNLDPALCKKEDVIRQALHAGLVGSNLKDSDSSSSNTDIDNKDDAEDKDDKDDNKNNRSQEFGWGGGSSTAERTSRLKLLTILCQILNSNTHTMKMMTLPGCISTATRFLPFKPLDTLLGAQREQSGTQYYPKLAQGCIEASP
ncbi:hypothetical protein DFH29DRAFT_880033 [Suillus ampliporus]|nr:hypothetical protein DFH29DRAFT_880033 [Suillus ampliporus]